MIAYIVVILCSAFQNKRTKCWKVTATPGYVKLILDTLLSYKPVEETGKQSLLIIQEIVL